MMVFITSNICRGIVYCGCDCRFSSSCLVAQDLDFFFLFFFNFPEQLIGEEEPREKVVVVETDVQVLFSLGWYKYVCGEHMQISAVHFKASTSYSEQESEVQPVCCRSRAPAQPSPLQAGWLLAGAPCCG